MKRETVYKIAIGILLMVNLAQITFRFMKDKPPRNPQENRKPNAVEILDLNSEQNRQFKEFSKAHHDAMMPLLRDQKQCVRDYFLEPTDSLLDCIKAMEAKKIKITEKHFDDMKSVLLEEQLLYYDEFKKESLRYILR